MNATVAKLSVPAVLFLTKSKISGNILECLKELAQQHDMAVFNGNKEKSARYYEKEINKEICYLENSVLMSESLLTDFLFKDRQKLICAMERLENCDIDSLACYEVAVVKVVGEHSDISPEYQYRLLRNIHDPAEFQKFYSDYLGSLQAYDMENNSNLVGTLQTYICNDCNLIKTSNELFLHKNTLRYRLQRYEISAF